MRNRFGKRKTHGKGGLGRFLVPCLCIIFAVLLVGLLVYSHTSASFRDKNSVARDKELLPLQARRAQLVAERSRVEPEEFKKLGCYSSISLIFKGADRLLYDSIFDIMSPEEDGEPLMTGVIALSPDDLPDTEGNVTSEELKEMIDAGWTAIVSYDGEGELGGYLDLMKETFEALGLESFDTVLFWDGSYSNQYNNILKDKGISFAVQNKGGLYPFVEIHTEPAEGEILIPGYVGWNNPTSKGAKYVYEYVTEKGGMTAFVVNFEKEGEAKLNAFCFTNDRKCKESFTRLVENTLYRDCTSGHLFVGNFSDALVLRKSFFEKKAAAEPIIAERLAELDRQIDELDRQINEVYSKYS